MAEYYTIITQYGESVMANAVNGQAITLEYMVFGDGNGISSNPDESATQLTNEQYRASLSELTASSEHEGWQLATAIIPADIGGFTVREIGLIDDTGNLFAIGSFHPTEKLAANDPLLVGMSSELTVDCYFAVSNQANINFTLDSNISTASRDYVNNQLQAIRFSAYFIGQS
jgi:phage-related tail fiber protein